MLPTFSRSRVGTIIVTGSCLSGFAPFGRGPCSRAKVRSSALSPSFIVKCVSPDAVDLQLIENASHIAGIAIERHIHEEALRHERDRLRLLLEITSSVTSRLDFRQVIEALSTNLFSVMQCDVSRLAAARLRERRVARHYPVQPRRERPHARGIVGADEWFDLGQGIAQGQEYPDR